jgi:hypothetical protein
MFLSIRLAEERVGATSVCRAACGAERRGALGGTTIPELWYHISGSPDGRGGMLGRFRGLRLELN